MSWKLWLVVLAGCSVGGGTTEGAGQGGGSLVGARPIGEILDGAVTDSVEGDGGGLEAVDASGGALVDSAVELPSDPLPVAPGEPVVVFEPAPVPPVPVFGVDCQDVVPMDGTRVLVGGAALDCNGWAQCDGAVQDLRFCNRELVVELPWNASVRVLTVPDNLPAFRVPLFQCVRVIADGHCTLTHNLGQGAELALPPPNAVERSWIEVDTSRDQRACDLSCEGLSP